MGNSASNFVLSRQASSAEQSPNVSGSELLRNSSAVDSVPSTPTLKLSTTTLVVPETAATTTTTTTTTTDANDAKSFLQILAEQRAKEEQDRIEASARREAERLKRKEEERLIAEQLEAKREAEVRARAGERFFVFHNGARV